MTDKCDLAKKPWLRPLLILILLFIVNEGGAMQSAGLKLKIIDRNGALTEELAAILPHDNFILGQNRILQNGDHLLIGLKAKDVGPHAVVSSSNTQQWFRDGKIEGAYGVMIDAPLLLIRLSNTLSQQWSREFKITSSPLRVVQIAGNRAYVLTAKNTVEEIDLADGKTLGTVRLGAVRLPNPVIPEEKIVDQWLVTPEKVMYSAPQWHKPEGYGRIGHGTLEPLLSFPVEVGKSDELSFLDTYWHKLAYLVTDGILVVDNVANVHRPGGPAEEIYLRIALYANNGKRLRKHLIGDYRRTIKWLPHDRHGVRALFEQHFIGHARVLQEWLDAKQNLYLAYQIDIGDRPPKQYVNKISSAGKIQWTTHLQISSSVVAMSVCETDGNIWIVSSDESNDSELLLLNPRGKVVIRKSLPPANAHSLSGSCTAAGTLNLFYTSGLK